MPEIPTALSCDMEPPLRMAAVGRRPSRGFVGLQHRQVQRRRGCELWRGCVCEGRCGGSGDSGGQAGKVDHRSCLRQPGGTTASPPGCDLDSSGQPPGTARDRLGCDLVVRQQAEPVYSQAYSPPAIVHAIIFTTTARFRSRAPERDGQSCLFQKRSAWLIIEGQTRQGCRVECVETR